MVVVMNFLAWGLFKLKFGRVSVRASNQMLMSAFEFIYAKRWFRQCPKLQSETRDNVPNVCEQLQPTERGKEVPKSFSALIL